MKCMKEKTIFAMISFFTLTILFAQPAKFTIKNNKTFKVKQRSGVKFPHGKHMIKDFSCKKCHHNYVNNKNVLDESQLVEENPKIQCANCHWRNKSGNRISLMDAYHLQCLGCHRNQDQKGKKTGPRICADCHPKKKQ